MIVVDVDFNTLMSLKGTSPTSMIYIEKRRTIDLYSKVDEFLYRFVYVKTNDENDTIFRENYMTNAMRVYAISNVNEDEWRIAFENMGKSLDEIKNLLGGKK